MKKILVTWLLLLGLTFIYNAQTNSGFVYYNNSSENFIILVDTSTNSLVYFRGVPDGVEKLDTGFEKWLKDRVDKGMPFKSMVIPFKYEQKRGN